MLQKLVTRVGTNLGRASYALTARRLSAPKRPTPYALPREGLAPSKEAGDAVIKVLNDFTPLVERIPSTRSFRCRGSHPISSVDEPKLQARSGAVCGQCLALASRARSAWRK